MVRVALDLDRPAFAALDDEAGREPVEDHRRRVRERHAGRDLGRPAGVRHDAAGRRTRAGVRAHRGDRHAEQLDELPP